LICLFYPFAIGNCLENSIEESKKLYQKRVTLVDKPKNFTSVNPYLSVENRKTTPPLRPWQARFYLGGGKILRGLLRKKKKEKFLNLEEGMAFCGEEALDLCPSVGITKVLLKVLKNCEPRPLRKIDLILSQYSKYVNEINSLLTDFSIET
jgi:hypothetical protein